MRSILDALPDPRRITLERPLEKLLGSRLLRRHDCVFLEAFMPRKTNVTRSSFVDRTGYECFMNVVHVEDFLESRTEELDHLRCQALAFAFRLAEVLKTHGDFKVLLSFSATTAVARFHQDRLGEAWLAADLESYANEAVLVLDPASRPGPRA